MSPTAVGRAAGGGRVSGLVVVKEGGLVSLGENLGMEFGVGVGLGGLGLQWKQTEEEKEAE